MLQSRRNPSAGLHTRFGCVVQISVSLERYRYHTVCAEVAMGFEGAEKLAPMLLLDDVKRIICVDDEPIHTKISTSVYASREMC